MTQREVDYKRARSIVERINALVHDGVPIHSHFTYEGYDFWQAYQMDLFVQAKRFTVDPESAIRGLQKSRELRFFSRFIFWFVSFIALYKSKFSLRKPILVYSVDKFPQGKYACDFRLNELYGALHETNAPFLELMYTPSASVLIKNMLKRKRVCIYTSAPDFWISRGMIERKVSNLYSDLYNTTDPGEARFVRELLTTLEYQFAFVPRRIMWIKKVLSTLSVPKMYLIDDMWHCFESLCAAQIENVSSVAIQHGHFTKYHFGVLPYRKEKSTYVKPHKIFVWTEYWKHELMRLGSFFKEEEIAIAGLKESIVVNRSEQVKVLQKIGVLIPYETDAPKASLRNCIAVLKQHPDIQLYFKPRSDLDTGVQCEQYGIDESVVVLQSVPYDSVQIVIGTYSTILYDMIGHGLSVLMLADTLDYGEGMVENGIAYRVNDPKNVYAVLEKVMEDRSHSVHKEQQRKLYGDTQILLRESLKTDILETTKYV